MVKIETIYSYLFSTIESKLNKNLDYVLGEYNIRPYKDDLDIIKNHCQTNPQILFECLDNIYTNVIECGDSNDPEKVVDALTKSVYGTELFRILCGWKQEIISFINNEHLRLFLDSLTRNVIIKVCKYHNIFNRETDMEASLPSLVEKEYNFRHTHPQKKTH